MTKQELLTKLAMECATWDEVANKSDVVFRRSPKDNELTCRFWVAADVTNQEWLAERERLLNKPSWKDAPKEATHLAMDSNGVHWFYNALPYPSTKSWKIDGIGNYGWEAGSAIAIPAGYDWRDSLEERPA